MDAAGITNNKHTTLTSKDVAVQWEQWTSFLQKKKKMIEEEIEHNKLRGVTAEQFKEFDKVFQQFDADKSGNIDKKELKACLYSLGEEKSKSEVEQIMSQYGGGKGLIAYEQFREFMINLLGVSVTKDDILNSFKLIIRVEDKAINVEKLELVNMVESDINYIKSSAPKEGSGYHYGKWTDDVFSR